MTSIVGYAAVFNRPSKLLGPFPSDARIFREIIKQGAFRDCLKEVASETRDIKALIGHDTNLILGTTKAKTLSLLEDSIGLRFECIIDEQMTYANDIYLSIKRGDVAGCSFNISVPSGGDTWEKQSDGTWIRVVKKILCQEISLTGFPAYTDTTCATSRAGGLIAIDTALPESMKERIERMNEVSRDMDVVPLSIRKKQVELLMMSL